MLAVRRLARSAERRATGRFVAEGPQAVTEALAAGTVLELYDEPGRHPDLAAAAAAAGAAVLPVAPPVLAALAGTVTPQGPVAVCRRPQTALADLRCHRLAVVLHRVADPGNAGTVLRTADAAGCDAVVLTAGSVDPYNPKCVRATAGSLWHLPVVAGADLGEAVARLRGLGLQVLATSGLPGAGADDLDDLADQGALAAPTAWLLGPEASGLDRMALELADRVVRIPLHGRAESLNLAAAAAVCLYASARALRRPPAPAP